MKRTIKHLASAMAVAVFLFIAFGSDDEETDNIVTKTSEKYTSYEAEQFMRKTCDNINQTLMKKKTVYLDGTKIYMFMSVAENGMTCISTVSEIKLEVMSADCDETQIKINQWNAVKDGASL
jgi:hypothetical protein